jgi:hypothetical protein
MTTAEVNKLIDTQYQSINAQKSKHGTYGLRELLLERIIGKCPELNHDRIGNAIRQWWLARATIEELQREAKELRSMAQENKKSARHLLHYADLWEKLALLREAKKKAAS